MSRIGGGGGGGGVAVTIDRCIKNPIASITKSVIADAFLFFGTPLHVKSFAEPTWSAWSSITIALLALAAINRGWPDYG